MDRIVDYYNTMMNNGDERVKDWFLMSSPIPTVLIVVVYLVAIKQGQKFMATRPAFDLKRPIILYNFFLVLLSAYMVKEIILTTWFEPKFNLICQPVDYSDDPSSERLARAMWWYYFSKIIELMDTIFFVLRKKNNQISFLHVYHHSVVPFLSWMVIKYIGGGESYFAAMFNSSIHVLMYLYYMLAAMGPSMQKFLWWKKYMTSLQLIQFVAVSGKCFHTAYLDCGYPRFAMYALSAFALSNMFLFSNFFYQNYIKKGSHKKTDSIQETRSPTNQGNGHVDSSNNGTDNGLRKRID